MPSTPPPISGPRKVELRGQAILNEPPPALTNLDSEDSPGSNKILTRPQNQQETGMRSTTATCPGTLEPARSVFDRRFRNPGLPVRQA